MPARKPAQAGKKARVPAPQRGGRGKARDAQAAPLVDIREWGRRAAERG